MSEEEKNAEETLLKKLLIIMKMLKIIFSLHQKLIKKNQNEKLNKVLQSREDEIKKTKIGYNCEKEKNI